MSDRIRIEKAEGTWVVRAGGAVIGESQNAFLLFENDYPFIVYFPRDDIAMAFLDASETTTRCPYKGDARYFSIQTRSVTMQDAAWSYETPNEGLGEIANHIAFMGEDITVERV